MDGEIEYQQMDGEIEYHKGCVTPYDLSCYTYPDITWSCTGVTYLNPEKKQNPMENFIEAFDICGPGSDIIMSILKKKHSKRTEKEKERIRWFMKENKQEKPKINLNYSSVVTLGDFGWEDNNLIYINSDGNVGLGISVYGSSYGSNGPNT